MSELSYKHDPDNGCIELMVNEKIITTWVCDGGDPEVEFADFKKIYHAGQEVLQNQLKWAYCDKICSDSIVGLDSCDDYRGWVLSLTDLVE